jgi:uncharacterized protein (TIGR02996 family)
MTESHFETILDANPSDWHARLLYADWLEEQGLGVRANGQRWQASLGKCPEYSNMSGLWHWRDFSKLRQDLPLQWSSLNECISKEIWEIILCSSYYTKMDTGFKSYDTRQDAEIALAYGLRRRGIKVEIQPAR